MEAYNFPYLVERGEDGWYIATVPALPGCHTQGRSREELRERIREAIALYLETLSDEEKDGLQNEYIGVERIEIAA